MKERMKNAKANEFDAAQIHFHHRTPPPRLLAFKNNPFLQTSLKGLNQIGANGDATPLGLFIFWDVNPA